MTISRVLQFGKHKGRRLCDVPDDYLAWLADTQEKTLREYRAEIDRRRALSDAKLSWEEKIVKEGYRGLSRKCHPDRGGHVSDMQNVNAAYEKLRVRLAGDR